MTRATIIGAVLGVVLAYLIGAFAGWQIDPGQWKQEARLYWICFAAVAAVMGGAAGSIK